MENLKQKFVAFLMEEEDGLWALKKHLYGHGFTSGGPDQAAWNAASANLARYLSHGDSDPMEFIAAAREFAPQSHKRTEGRARALTPHYAEAVETWDAAAASVLRRMPKWQANLLGDFGRSLWRRSHVQPTAEVVDEKGLVRLARKDKSDRWYLQYDGMESSGPYLRTGHLSPTNLRIQAVRQGTANEKVEVVSVLVEHRDPCDRPECPLPAACEIVLAPWGFPRWSPWRCGVRLDEALAPHVAGPLWGLIRLGDVVFSRYTGDASAAIEVPRWLERVTGIKVFELPGCRTEHYAVVEVVAEVSHPDHYAVGLEVGARYIAHPCVGQTQYRPREHRGD